MFGSDFPMWTPETELETFLSLDFTAEEQAMILSGNAKTVFDLT